MSSERLVTAYALMELLEHRPEGLEKVKVMWVDGGYTGDTCYAVMLCRHDSADASSSRSLILT